MTKIRSGPAAATVPTTSNRRRFLGSPDVALLGTSSSSAYFVESSRKAALGHQQRRVLCLVLVSLLGLLTFFSIGKPQLSDLLLGPNEDGKSRAAKKQISRIIVERTNHAAATGADINSSANMKEAKRKQVHSCYGGCLTTHVLDTANGIPAEGMRVELYQIQKTKDEQNEHEDGETKTKLGTFTNRIDGSSLISENNFIAGTYGLMFRVADYFDSRIEVDTKPRDGIPFLSTVPIRFGVNDSTMNYHIPLLVSKYSYSTYRGS